MALPLGRTVFGYSGGTATYVADQNQRVELKMWGAGAGRAFNAATGGVATSSPGGGGGFTTYVFDLLLGDQLDLQVGQGSLASTSTSTNSAGGYPDGGNAGRVAATGCFAGGGGSTRAFVNGVLVAVAGGGGGGVYANASLNYGGGHGGGSDGGAGVGIPFATDGGQFGTQSAGGAKAVGNTNASANGSFLQGGTGGTNTTLAGSGSGGGGGYYGGGAGSYTNTSDLGSAGGGSGYVNTSYAGYVSGTTTAGSGVNCGGMSDPEFPGQTNVGGVVRYDVGMGGGPGGNNLANATGGQGGHGLIIMRASSALPDGRTALGTWGDYTFIAQGPGVMSVKVWGAGGSGAAGSATAIRDHGGSGGYTTAFIPFAIGDEIKVVVGQGGQPPTTGVAIGAIGGYPDGGPSSYSSTALVMQGSGGGSSAIYRNGVVQVVAGAGGGGVTYGSTATTNQGGGGGGGTTAPSVFTANGANTNTVTGGSASVGGNNPFYPSSGVSGSAFRGGNGFRDGFTKTSIDAQVGGGGGGGYYGGAGGPFAGATRPTGGSGGSGYVLDGLSGSTTSATGSTTNGGSSTPGGADDVDYVFGVGLGGVSAGGAGAGGDGYVVIVIEEAEPGDAQGAATDPIVLTAPTAIGMVPNTGTGSIPTILVTSPDGSAGRPALGDYAFPPAIVITPVESNPTTSALITVPINNSTPISLTPPTPGLIIIPGAATGQTIPPIVIGWPEGSVSAAQGPIAPATGDIGTITLTAPEGETSVVNPDQEATGDIATVTVTAPVAVVTFTGSATGGAFENDIVVTAPLSNFVPAEATGDIATVTVTAPVAVVTFTGSATGGAFENDIVVTAPVGEAFLKDDTEITVPFAAAITVTPPEALAIAGGVLVVDFADPILLIPAEGTGYQDDVDTIVGEGDIGTITVTVPTHVVFGQVSLSTPIDLAVTLGGAPDVYVTVPANVITFQELAIILGVPTGQAALAAEIVVAMPPAIVINGADAEPSFDLTLEFAPPILIDPPLGEGLGGVGGEATGEALDAILVSAPEANLVTPADIDGQPTDPILVIAPDAVGSGEGSAAFDIEGVILVTAPEATVDAAVDLTATIDSVILVTAPVGAILADASAEGAALDPILIVSPDAAGLGDASVDALIDTVIYLTTPEGIVTAIGTATGEATDPILVIASTGEGLGAAGADADIDSVILVTAPDAAATGEGQNVNDDLLVVLVTVPTVVVMADGLAYGDFTDVILVTAPEAAATGEGQNANDDLLLVLITAPDGIVTAIGTATGEATDPILVVTPEADGLGEALGVGETDPIYVVPLDGIVTAIGTATGEATDPILVVAPEADASGAAQTDALIDTVILLVAPEAEATSAVDQDAVIDSVIYVVALDGYVVSEGDATGEATDPILVSTPDAAGTGEGLGAGETDPILVVAPEGYVISAADVDGLATDPILVITPAGAGAGEGAYDHADADVIYLTAPEAYVVAEGAGEGYISDPATPIYVEAPLANGLGYAETDASIDSVILVSPIDGAAEGGIGVDVEGFFPVLPIFILSPIGETEETGVISLPLPTIFVEFEGEVTVETPVDLHLEFELIVTLTAPEPLLRVDGNGAGEALDAILLSAPEATTAVTDDGDAVGQATDAILVSAPDAGAFATAANYTWVEGLLVYVGTPVGRAEKPAATVGDLGPAILVSTPDAVATVAATYADGSFPDDAILVSAPDATATGEGLAIPYNDGAASPRLAYVPVFPPVANVTAGDVRFVPFADPILVVAPQGEGYIPVEAYAEGDLGSSILVSAPQALGRGQGTALPPANNQTIPDSSTWNYANIIVIPPRVTVGGAVRVITQQELAIIIGAPKAITFKEADIVTGFPTIYVKTPKAATSISSAAEFTTITVTPPDAYADVPVDDAHGRILYKRSQVHAHAPAVLNPREIAFNEADGVMYSRDRFGGLKPTDWQSLIAARIPPVGLGEHVVLHADLEWRDPTVIYDKPVIAAPPHGALIALADGVVGAQTFAPTLGAAYYRPFFLPKAVEISSLAIDVVAVANATAQIAIVGWNLMGAPGDVKIAGAIATDIAGLQTAPATAVSLVPGWYAVRFIVQGSGAPSFRVASAPPALRPDLGTKPADPAFVYAQLET